MPLFRSGTELRLLSEELRVRLSPGAQDNANVVERQSRQLEVLVTERSWGFDSPHSHNLAGWWNGSHSGLRNQ